MNSFSPDYRGNEKYPDINNARNNIDETINVNPNPDLTPTTPPPSPSIWTNTPKDHPYLPSYPNQSPAYGSTNPGFPTQYPPYQADSYRPYQQPNNAYQYPVYPHNPALKNSFETGKPGKKSRKIKGWLLLGISILLIIALSLLGIFLYQKIASSPNKTLDKGIKAAWGQEVSNLAQGVQDLTSSYAMYLSDKQIALIMLDKNQSGKVQYLSSKDGKAQGAIKDLPVCNSKLIRPYVVRDSTIVCAKEDTVKENKDDKYRFTHQIYKDNNVIIGAAPSADQASIIVAYSPKSNKPLWMEKLPDKPSVYADKHGVYTNVSSPKEGGVLNKPNFYIPSDNSGKSPIKESDIPKVEKFDAIKDVDFENLFFPHADFSFIPDDKCVTSYWQDDRKAPQFQKMPDDPEDCWLELRNGLSIERTQGMEQGTTDPLVDISNNGGNQDDKGFTPDPNHSRFSYADVNQDGYLDALIYDNVGVGWQKVLCIFDPDDSGHPYCAHIVGGAAPYNLNYLGNGKISVYQPPEGKPELEMTIGTQDGKPVITDFQKLSSAW